MARVLFLVIGRVATRVLAFGSAVLRRLARADESSSVHWHCWRTGAQPWLCVEARGDRKFDVQDHHVHQLHILSSAETRRDTVEVHWRGQKVTKAAREHVRGLLREFVERFDRTFLPVADLVLP